VNQKRLAKFVALFLSVGLLVTACGGGAKPAENTPAPAAAAPKEVAIGAIYPLSGPSAVAGKDLTNGVTLAMEIINGQHPELDLPQAKWKGIPNLGNAQLKVVFADHQADPNKGKSEAERLITQEKVVALQGGYNSAVTAAIAPVAERYEVPHLNADSTSPSLTEQGFKYFFRTTPHDGSFVENAYQFFDDLKKAGTIKGTEKIAMAMEDGLWGQDTAKSAKALAGKNGWNIVEEIAYSSKAANVDAEVQRIKAKNPEFVMMASYGPDAILFLKAFKGMDVNPKLIWGNDSGFVDTQFIKTLGKDAEYLVSREVWANDLAAKKPIIGQLNTLFKSKFGAELNGSSARALQGTLVLADAINRAKSTDPKAIQAALKATNLGAGDIVMPWKGIKFDEKGQNTLGAGIIVQVQNGAYTTVWPFDVAAGKLVYPIPAWKDRK
jgi:branched-chain amino acid transport system substrate-binding protein